ncbi:hypothetical protein D9619_013653 [Psilocybe cf. subviscida]|uniref:Uncharacterized protein n=1 Tax=Psilocybe cf. subviscida TaxID=2480587 RepID=A0A8H5BRK1_9AGAR|nr:hypothetical protein D9619_013653 [Psilocybe cf. subviscida]
MGTACRLPHTSAANMKAKRLSRLLPLAPLRQSPAYIHNESKFTTGPSHGIPQHLRSQIYLR